MDAAEGRVAEQFLELTGGRGVDVAIDFVCSTSTLESAFAALGKRGRLVTLGGHGASFTARPAEMLRKEIELLGSRYATQEEVVESLERVARGDVWPLVTGKAPLEGAEDVHQRLDKGLIIGRAALMVQPACANGRSVSTSTARSSRQRARSPTTCFWLTSISTPA